MKIPRVGGRVRLCYIQVLHCHQQDDSSINMDSDKTERHFNILLTVRGKLPKSHKTVHNHSQFLMRKES